jgi:hypothetical protein
MKENILSVYCKATAEDVSGYKGWFERAALYSSHLSDKYGVSRVVSSGCIAGLSPIKSWNENQRIADAYFQGRYYHVGRQIEKCHRIKEKNSYIHTINILGGLKTRNFFRNILDPRDRNAVTIDRHCISMAYGYNKYECTDKQYMDIVNVFKEIAVHLNLIPSEFQSIVWCKYRELKKIKL